MTHTIWLILLSIAVAGVVITMIVDKIREANERIKATQQDRGYGAQLTEDIAAIQDNIKLDKDEFRRALAEARAQGKVLVLHARQLGLTEDEARKLDGHYR